MDTIRAIIFDLDGVICFTDNYHYQGFPYGLHPLIVH